MNAWRLVAWTALALLALWALGLWLWRGDARDRDSGPARLIAPERSLHKTVAAISVRAPGHETEFFYARSKGLWRSREAFGAVVDPDLVAQLVGSFFDARGIELPAARDASAAHWGVEPGNCLRVSFHGPKVLDAPDRDTLFAFDVATRRGAGSSALLREVGTRRVLEIDRDPWAPLTRAPNDTLPPMCDTRLLAGSTAPDFTGFKTMFVDLQSGASFALEVQPGATQAETKWMLVEGQVRREAIVWRAGGYVSLWIRGRYTSVRSPAQLAQLGLDPPHATLTLAPTQGEPLVFAISKRDPSNQVYAWNKHTNVVYALPGEWLELLVPPASAFTDATIANPWERWLAR